MIYVLNTEEENLHDFWMTLEIVMKFHERRNLWEY